MPDQAQRVVQIFVFVRADTEKMDLFLIATPQFQIGDRISVKHTMQRQKPLFFWFFSAIGNDDIRVFSGAFPIKDFYTFCNELHLQVNGDVSDYTIALTEENETHNYRFSYSFYDDIGFYYLKDGEKKYDYIWSFSLGYGLVSEITGMSLSC